MKIGAYNNVNNIETKNRDLSIYSAAAPNAFQLKHDTGNIGLGTAEPDFAMDLRKAGQYPFRVGDNLGNDLTVDLASGTGLANLVAGGKKNGKSRLSIYWHTRFI